MACAQGHNQNGSSEQKNDFVLYIFKDDIDEFSRLIQGSPNESIIGGSLMGLWTNSRNPVIHIVCLENTPTESYTFLKSHHYTDCGNDYRGYGCNSRNMFKHIGYWYFNLGNNVKQEPQDPKTVYLEVNKTEQGLIFNPYRISNGNIYHGKLETLLGQHPFKLTIDESRNKEDPNDGNQPGIVEKMIQKFEFFGNKKDQIMQWYKSHNGEKYLQTIYSKMNDMLNNSVKIKRNEENHNIFLEFEFEDREFVLDFPADFPGHGARIYHKLSTNDTQKLGSDTACNDPTEFVQNLMLEVFKHFNK